MARNDYYFGWIEACLLYGGAFGASEKAIYCQRYGLSEPSASRHQVTFADHYQRASGVVFARSADGRLQGGRLTPMNELPRTPIFDSTPSLERWLEDCFSGTRFFNIEILREAPEPSIVRAIIRSIKTKTPLSIDYHSRRQNSRRTISPHTLIKIAGRLHIRAFDHSRNDFADFVLSRITKTTADVGSVFIDGHQDEAWRCQETLVVKATDATSEGVKLDFGLDASGSRSFRVRTPLVQYLIDEMDEAYSPPVRVMRRP
ncbi:hypothetical protein BFP70_14465 [Thioclava sp. SK-1]|uniref:WYL domain-containing protein n=1 Tax=Thioclava sp. SK-1 TaxID=1889770 RepID=UPI00082534A1|nr:WYL domain-containing protein [Thioclava sp. SK-1]OCX62057.1 hypothetical protein BFP70_14465 [Thioclava sp. SK-1]